MSLTVIGCRSPEAVHALRSVPIGTPADVWSLAATIVHMLKGAPPYAGRDMTQIWAALKDQEAPVLPSK